MDHQPIREELALLLQKSPNIHKVTLYDVYRLFGVTTQEEQQRVAEEKKQELKEAITQIHQKLGKILSKDKTSPEYKEWIKESQNMNFQP